ncbi:kinase-like protein [Hypoxylon crocopeplum]|nr:kinase-like protein [Hypoxylon crocopeplum]
MPVVRPIAQISCWVTKAQLEGYKPPEGFCVNASLEAQTNRRDSQLFIDVPLFPGRDISIGRDHHENDISINHPYVSRKHFVIYSINYGPDTIHNQPPLIYVRDYQSLEGTYVNGVCIGNKEKGASEAVYLSRDVEIAVKPYWTFRVSLLEHRELKSPLNAIQLKESSLFEDRYIITNRTLGSGSFASVHLAINVETGRQVACKIHDLDRLRRFADPLDLVRRVEHETDLLGKLRHPNVPTFEYAFRSAHTLYTFVELAAGGDLFSKRQERGPFQEEDCKFVIRQIVNAVRYLHKGGVAHRDLKPENILFATGPEITSRVIVGDLGLARSTASGRMASRVGTSHYMAPEVGYGQAYNLEIDIWSIGMIMVFLLAPNDNVTPSGIVKMSQVAIDAWLDSVFYDSSHHRVSKRCEEFVRSCLMFEPIDRITASEAKHHPWFQRSPDRGQLRFRLKETVESWKPAHLIAPPIQKLPDMEDVRHGAQSEEHDDNPGPSVASAELRPSPATRKRWDVAFDTDNPAVSSYFTDSNPAAPNRYCPPNRYLV